MNCDGQDWVVCRDLLPAWQQPGSVTDIEGEPEHRWVQLQDVEEWSLKSVTVIATVVEFVVSDLEGRTGSDPGGNSPKARWWSLRECRSEDSTD